MKRGWQTPTEREYGPFRHALRGARHRGRQEEFADAGDVQPEAQSFLETLRQDLIDGIDRVLNDASAA